MFPRRLHPLQRQKLLKATVFDGNRRDGSLNVPPTFIRGSLFSSRQWGALLGEAFIILGRYRFCPPFSRTTARNKTRRSQRFKFTAPAVRDVSLYFIWHGTFARQVKLPRDPARS